MNTLKLYFPSTDKNNHPLDQSISSPLYKDIIKNISEVAGGCTTTPCQGYYVNAVGKLIQDDISLITVFTSELERMTELMRTNAMMILKSLNQESVLVEVNNSLEFITDED